MIRHGHNEAAVRLAALAGDAQIALDCVARGEAEAIDGWLAYGAALNEGRALFPGDKEFGRWVSENVLGQVAQGEVEPKEQQAAMWAAANRDQFDEARAAGKARTVRGIHAKWKEIEAAREKEAREAEQQAETERKKADDLARVATVTMNTAAIGARSNDGQKAESAQQAENKPEIADEGDEGNQPVQTDQENTSPADPIDPAEAKARRDLAKLTPAALVDEVIGLREALAEAKAKAKAQAQEISDLKADLAAFKQDDMGRALGNAQRQARTAEGRMKEYQATAVRADRRAKILEAENARLKAEIENQVIPL